MGLKKYWIISKGIIQETMMYRLNFVMWRVRGILQFLIMYYLWIALLPPGSTLFGYSQKLIMTYMFTGNILSSIIFSTRAGGLGEEINNGNLSNHLIRPVNYFLVWAATDIGDKIMNISFSLVEFVILFSILKPPFLLQTNPLLILLTILSVIIATIIFFFLNMLLGCIGFWSNEVWAPRFIFGILFQFFSGGTFPLDILPKPLFYFFQATPFPYLLYFPLKIYLGQLSPVALLTGFLISTGWVFGTYILLKTVWNKGLFMYTAQGR